MDGLDFGLVFSGFLDFGFSGLFWIWFFWTFGLLVFYWIWTFWFFGLGRFWFFRIWTIGFLDVDLVFPGCWIWEICSPYLRSTIQKYNTARPCTIGVMLYLFSSHITQVLVSLRINRLVVFLLLLFKNINSVNFSLYLNFLNAF